MREDERHVLECPLYAELRDRFKDVVPIMFAQEASDHDFHKIWDKPGRVDWNRLADFLICVEQKRTAHLSADLNHQIT